MIDTAMPGMAPMNEPIQEHRRIRNQWVKQSLTPSSMPVLVSTSDERNCHHSVALSVKLPAHRLIPTALVATESQLVVTPVCSARTLADGRPPMGIACAQQDLSRVYPLSDDPERCVADFLDLAAEHALLLAERLEHQEASVQRFMELSDP